MFKLGRRTCWLCSRLAGLGLNHWLHRAAQFSKAMSIMNKNSRNWSPSANRTLSPRAEVPTGYHGLSGELVSACALLSCGLLGCGSDGGVARDQQGAANAGSQVMTVSEWTPPEVVPANTPVSRNGALRVEGAQLLNEQGEPVQLKGVSSMWLNWENTGYAESLEGLEWMRDNWNLSVIRAAMGIEPNGAYLTNRSRALRQVRTIVHNAIDAGVYVIIDWHDHEAESHQSDAVEFFETMAAEFGEFPNVFYETYNEPENNGGIKSWEDLLKPYHEAVVQGIRANDPDNIAILGTGQWSQRVDHVLASPLDGDNLMYTVHFYACTHGNQERAYANQAFNSGLPIFVTEWGATLADGGTNGNGGVCEEDAQEWHDFMNLRNMSWAAWKLDDCNDVSCFFRSGASRNGGWDDSDLNGHARFVIDRMLE